MLNPFRLLEKLLYLVRDGMWNYPDRLWGGERSLRARFAYLYYISRPFSHFANAAIVVLVVVVIGLHKSQPILSQSREQKLIEGVVIGTDENGVLQKLSKVNPIIPSSIQLEKDLSELIYEPLIRYEQDGTITPVLAERIIRISEGADYEFKLRGNVFWHDGRKFRVDDVVKTFEIVAGLNEANSFVQAVKQMAWERTGDDSIRICTTTAELLERLLPSEVQRPCSATGNQKPILANFLELISIKIMPAHLTADLNALNISTPEPGINRFPVGTGPYKFDGAGATAIYLSLNREYYLQIPAIKQIEFRLFRTEQDAVRALQNGETHSLASVSTQYFRETGLYPQLNELKSPVQQSQYWAIYFNLRKDLDGNTLGPAFFQDVAVRQAVSSAVNRSRIVEVLLGVGEEALGPIYTSNFFFNSRAGFYRYDIDRAKLLLDKAGWKVDPVTGIRIKDGLPLSFRLSFNDNFDRNKVVESIRLDLREIGIEMIPDPRILKSLTEEVVTPKLFDALLFGMSTFIDPDRYELFHSEQDLNLASYKGSVQTVKIENRKTVRLPKVDRLLEQGRSFDPFAARSQRKTAYDELQQLIAADAPVVFLYHPEFIYYSNKRLENVDLARAYNLEQRFRNIAKWRIAG